jgi:hypothetical protein
MIIFFIFFPDINSGYHFGSFTLNRLNSNLRCTSCNSSFGYVIECTIERIDSLLSIHKYINPAHDWNNVNIIFELDSNFLI